jgi:hypothetical protein
MEEAKSTELLEDAGRFQREIFMHVGREVPNWVG